MSRRMDRVNELLKREISSVLQRDFEWKGLLVTVNSVEVSQDLKDARVYVGVLGGHEERVIGRLNGERGSIQGRVGHQKSISTSSAQAVFWIWGLKSLFGCSVDSGGHSL